MKKVLVSGHCNFDYPLIKEMLKSNFEVTLYRATGNVEAINLLKTQKYDLVLVNRIGAFDNLSGIDVIKFMQTQPMLRETPAMLITNYPKYMQDAMNAGAVKGFGKDQLQEPATIELLKEYLD